MFFKKYTANDWCSSKPKLTPAQCFLENYLQHPKKSYFSDIYTEWNDSHFLVHQMAWVTCDRLCKKAQKLWKSWKGNTALTNYVSLMQCKFVTVLSITSNIFWETEVEILGLGCERKHDLIHRSKVNKAYKFVLYMSKQSINFKNAETSWFRGLFLHLHTKKMISVHQHMAFVTVNRFCLL